ncbi:protein translocase SEC61 complex subunit gamma [archaeon]|nr:protein translocase SEC61 complex subunit gamma [archaeon]
MSFINEAIRVLKLTRKPKQDEFMLIAKITGAGMIIIGLIGSLIQILGLLLGLRG